MAQRVRTDWLLFTTILAMTVAGMVVLWSASSIVAGKRYGSEMYFGMRQMGWAVLAFGVMMALKTADYRRFMKGIWVFPAVSLVVALLLAAYLTDPAGRWVRLGPLSLQPSELAKPVLILFLAYLLTKRRSGINSRQYTLLPIAAIVTLMAGAVVVADLGTAIILAGTAAAVVILAGVQWRYFAAAAALGCVLLTAAVLHKPYRVGRVFGFYDPDYKLLDTELVRRLDPEGRWKMYLQTHASTENARSHLEESLIAVGSGGVLGKGPMQSTQKMFYLPEAHTDFIYAVLAEEYGMVGALLMLACFMVIFWRGMRIYFRTGEDFGRHLALGVTVAITLQAMVNMSVVTGLVPTKGIPLPLVSYGGSSLLSTLISLGLLQSVGDHSA